MKASFYFWPAKFFNITIAVIIHFSNPIKAKYFISFRAIFNILYLGAYKHKSNYFSFRSPEKEIHALFFRH